MGRTASLTISAGDFDDPRVLALLRLHLAGMHANSPPGHVFALDLSGLRQPSISFFTAWSGENLAGMGALKDLGDGTGELKSMRTDPRYLRQGIGAMLLDYLLAVARARGYRRVSLETGSGEAFEAAIAMYRKRGFVDGVAFGDYLKSPFNQFLHLQLVA